MPPKTHPEIRPDTPADIPSLPLLVDSHCHLDFPDFEGQTDELIARAAAAGVTRMVTICTRIARLPLCQGLAEAHPGVFYTYGVHPLHVTEEPAITAPELIALSQHPKFVALGETGLDFHYTPETRDAQLASLQVHIEAAQLSRLPLVIHSRDADADMERLLTDGMKAAPFSCVMHCYTSGARLAEVVLDLGFYLSMSGIAAFPKSQEIRDIFARAPLERVLVETDSPYLAPPPYRGKRNEPAYVAHTARVGAGLFGLSEAEFARATSANFDRLFPRAAAFGALPRDVQPPAGGHAPASAPSVTGGRP
ncbi:TatD family hydrolase [Paracoccus sp. IB05]|uniref:TatD family hydrolase n=1 Tax=Paracoccus sp. IB05 TaxID=2779367 RepID=UPI0018E8EE33|nr:TatD family hydrolase [Paracoccus sp. IB05]MBJ2151746.1 TatD family hydrolase [Paracoccus sp. IB05]